MNPLPLVVATLRRHRAAFALFVALIAVAVALGIAVSASERALRQGSARAADKFDLAVAAPGSRTDALFAAIYLRPGTLPLMDGATVARVLGEPRAQFAAPIAFGDSFHGSPVVGTIPAFVEHLSGSLAEGRMFARPTEVVAGAAATLRLGETFRPQHGDGKPDADDDDDDGDHHQHAIDLTVVGRMKPTGTPWDRAYVVPVELVWQVHGLPDGHGPPGRATVSAEGATIGPPFEPAFVPGVPAIIVRPQSVADAYGLRSLFKTPTSMAFFPAEALVDLYAVMADARGLVTIVAGAAQGLVALAILAALTALMNLNRRQFATLRVIGAPRGFLAAAVWLHVVTIVVAGALIGLLLGLVAAQALAAIVSARTGVALVATVAAPEVRLVSVFVAAAFVLALIPAWLAASGDAAEALRDA